MKISVITSSISRRGCMLRLLRNLAEQTLLPDEIILTEVGTSHWSEDDAPLILRERFKVFYGPNESTTVTRDRGRKAASGDLLFFFDDDVVIPTTYIADAVAYLIANEDVIGIGGGYVDDTTRNRSTISIAIGRLFGIYANGSCNRILKSGWADYVRPPFAREITHAQWLFGCNYVIRANAFKNPKIKHETQMATWSFLDDVLLGSNLTKVFGDCLRILPSLEVVHAPVSSSGKISRATLRMRILYRWILWRDHLVGVCQRSSSAFFWGMVANLLLMLKQERKFWVFVESLKTYCHIIKTPQMDWKKANEFIFS